MLPVSGYTSHGHGVCDQSCRCRRSETFYRAVDCCVGVGPVARIRMDFAPSNATVTVQATLSRPRSPGPSAT